MDHNDQRYFEAQELFQSLRYQTGLEKSLGLLRRKPSFLCEFEGIRRDLHLHTQIYRGVQEIPLSQIMGSVGKSQDFTRHFRPRRRNMRDRWAKVYTGVTGLAGLPPVKLYQVCDTYFVVDGHHRVSVANYLRARTIEAEVIAFSLDICLPAACR